MGPAGLFPTQAYRLGLYRDSIGDRIESMISALCSRGGEGGGLHFHALWV